MMMTAVLMVMAACAANAQSADDFFVGKWHLEVTGTPQGDSEIDMVVKRADDGKLTGEMVRDESVPIKFDRIDEKKGKSIKAYFKRGEYDVYLYLEKNSDDELDGSMMEMFDVTGKRVKE